MTFVELSINTKNKPFNQNTSSFHELRDACRISHLIILFTNKWFYRMPAGGSTTCSLWRQQVKCWLAHHAEILTFLWLLFIRLFYRRKTGAWNRLDLLTGTLTPSTFCIVVLCRVIVQVVKNVCSFCGSSILFTDWWLPPGSAKHPIWTTFVCAWKHHCNASSCLLF